MGLGTNRDYKTRDKNILKAMKEKNIINLWECSSCGRKNLMKFINCPRCKMPKEIEYLVEPKDTGHWGTGIL